MHIRQSLYKNNDTTAISPPIDAATAKVWNSPESVRLDPRSLADVAIANAEVSWKNRLDREEYLRRRAEIRKHQEEEHIRKRAEYALSKSGVKNNGNETIVIDAREGGNGVQSFPNSTAADEYVKKIAGMHLRRTTKHRNPMKMNEGRPPSSQANWGMLPVLTVIFICTLFRICVSVTIGRLSDDIDIPDAEDDEDPSTNITTGRGLRRGGLSSFMTTMSGGREALRLRRRARQRHFQTFVDRLNTQRRQNGERTISADALRLVVSSRDFDPNDYDRLLQFNEENGPAIGSLFSVLGATETEINRCPSRVLREDDDLIRSRRGLGVGVAGEDRGGDQHLQTCSVCLEPYQTGDTVRTIPCFHTFHASCIDPWLAEKAECPICKHSAIG